MNNTNTSNTNPLHYQRVHKFLQHKYGKPKDCDFCHSKTAKRYDWALKKGCQYDFIRQNFYRLCKSCHVNYDYTEAAKQKISKTLKGNIPWNKGKTLSDEHKKKLSISHTGIPLPESAKRKLRIYNTGRVNSFKTRQKISASKKGHIVSAETRKKISNTLKRRAQADTQNEEFAVE